MVVVRGGLGVRAEGSTTLVGMAIADLRSGAKNRLARSRASSGRFDLSAIGGRVAMSGLRHCLAGHVSVAAGPDSC